MKRNRNRNSKRAEPQRFCFWDWRKNERDIYKRHGVFNKGTS